MREPEAAEACRVHCAARDMHEQLLAECSPLITRIGQRVHRADLHHSTPVHSTYSTAQTVKAKYHIHLSISGNGTGPTIGSLGQHSS